MRFQLPSIYPITDTKISGLSHLEQVERLVAGGAEFIQLRDKLSSPNEFYAAASEVMRFARQKSLRIIINDRVDIALAAGAEGVHLGQDDLSLEHARRLLGPDAVIGFSTHSVEQAIAAVSLPVDYVAIGPVFPTSTKTDPDDVVGLEGVRRVRKTIGSFPLVAIGGITSANVNDVLEAGANSVAVISDLLRDPKLITEHTRDLFKKTS